MALNLGDLVGFIKLDDSNFDSVLDKLPGKIKGGGVAMAGAGLLVGGVIAAALIGGLNDAMNFDKTNDLVAAQMGLTATESARVGTLAGTLYAQNYGESVGEVQNTIGGIVSQIEGMGSASDATVEAMTAKVLNYSSAFGTDTADNIAMVQQLMTSGLAPSANAAMDLMTTAMQKVPEALRGDMADAITEYGPLMAQMGFTGEEAFGLLAKGAEQGMYGIDKAGDAVKEFGIRATDMSTASKVGYDALGLSQQEMSAALLAGGDTAKGAFDTIIGGLNGMTDPVAQSQAALALFGTPLEDLGVSKIPKFLGSLSTMGDGFGDVAGAADAMGGTMNDNASGGMDGMNRSIEMIFAGLGEKLLPILNEVFGFLANNQGVLMVMIGVLGFLALAFVGITIATWAMNTALLASPITWIVLGIVALIAALVLLVMNWDTVVAFISEIWGGFIGWLTQGLDEFLGWWNSLWTSVWEGITGIWDSMVSWVLAKFLGFVGTLIIGGAVVSGWWNNLWSGISAFVSGIWNGIVAFVTGAFARVVGAAVGAFNGLVSFLSGIWSSISSGVSGAIGGIITYFSGLGGRILGALGNMGSLLTNMGKNIIEGLLNGIKATAGRVFDFIGGIASSIGSTFAKVLGIKSPSRVFAEFGRNTVQGYMQGLDKLTPELDRQMGDLVLAPSDRNGTQGAAPLAPNSTGRTSTSTTEIKIMGNVGWDPDEVARELDERQRQAAALAGLNDLVGVA